MTPRSHGRVHPSFRAGLATFLGALLTLVAPMVKAEPRIAAWRSVDGLPQSATLGVTLGPRGRVLTTHAPSLPLARLDGFSVTSVSNTVGAVSRVHESRSEQLWCVTPEGLLDNTGQGWNSHPIPEIAAEFRANPLRAIRPIPLLPLDRHRVLILLPDRIMEYDANDHRSGVILQASATSLGRFIELNSARDDGAWISGARGLIRIPAPLRHIRSGTRFEEFVVPENLGATELQRPFEGRDGSVVLSADDRVSHERLVLRFTQANWERWSVPGQNLRQAWSGPDGELWGHTSGTVFQFERHPEGLRPVPVLRVGRVADIALEPRGAAWIATSEGLFRIAPLPWRPVPGLDPEIGAVQGIASDRRGRLVAVSPNSVLWFDEIAWRATRFRTPPEEETPGEDEKLYPLPDGSVLVRADATNHVFDVAGHRVHPSWLESGALPVGILPDGRLVLQPPAPGHDRLAAFDGNAVRPFAELPADHAELGRLTLVLPTRAGELMIGGPRGIALRRGGQWKRFEVLDSETTSLPFDGALAGVELPDGRILVGGADVLREFDGKSWRILRRGMERVHAIHPTLDGTLWIATASGLHRYRDRSWFVLGEEEGLPSGVVYSVFADGSGRLWAGTARGLYALDITADTDSPRALISDADLPIRAGENRARFVVGGEDQWRYTPAGRLLFSWRLDNGPWSIWRAASSDQFTNLSSGTHRFEARALDPTGNADGPTAVYEFAVMLPWFKDPRLVLASAGLALLAIALISQAVHGYSRLKQSYAEVERQVAERSAALEKANADLLQSHKMRALGTLAAGVAHDFNNLLSIIKGSAQLLESQLHDADKARQRLVRIKTAVEQGAGLVKAMLGYSRDATAARKLIQPVEAVRQTIRLMEERLPGRLEFIPPSTPPPTALAQPEMLQQILLNLIQNADEAMDLHGTVQIAVSTLSKPPDDCCLQPIQAARYVGLTVRDRGIGIPPENLPRIFEPFFTTKGFSSRRGTGLGLSMVYEFAKEMGAGIAVTSALGQGTTFQVILPAAPGPR
ncbi:MAG: ATP-binding protein [Limisphaerales bacterium]